MESKWFVIIFMVLSFVYRMYKKSKSGSDDSQEQEPSNSGNNAWGIGDLISQFETDYGKDVGIEEEKIDFRDTNNLVFDSPETVAESVEYFPTEKASEKNRSFDENSKKEVEPNFPITEKMEASYEVDLEQIVISSAILNRPEY